MLDSIDNIRFKLANAHLAEMGSSMERVMVDLIKIQAQAAAIAELVPEWSSAQKELDVKGLVTTSGEFYETLYRFTRSVGL